MRNNFRRRRKKKLKTKQILLIIILFLFAISASYAMFSTQLFINGTVTGEQEQFSVLYINMDNTSTYPPSIGYMSTYSYTFAIPPVIQSITMGGTPLVANTDYTYTNGTLTIPNVTGNLVIQGDDDAPNINVTFDNDGITNTVTVKQGKTVPEPQAPLKQGYGFLGWTDSNDVFFDFTTPIMADITLYAKWIQGYVAEINGTYYTTLQAAIDAVPTNDTETTVKLLTDVSENLIVDQGQNINFDFRTFTISITTGTLLENSGTVKISNGVLTSSSTQTATINNQSTGNITISGGKVMMTATNGKQALYNDQGVVLITGSAYLSSVSGLGNNKRATVQNLASGTLTITGGTIEAFNYQGVNNAGTMTIGTQDGNPDKNSLVIKAATDGIVSTTNFSFYDGIIKAKTRVVDDETKITNIETGYSVTKADEDIEGQKYKTMYLAISNTVIFDANGGTVSEPTRNVESGHKIGTLPIPTRTNYVFEGWFTEDEGGTKINEDTVITNDVRYYAHWGDIYFAQIGETKYETIHEAVEAVPNNTQTTIKILKDVTLTQRISVANKKNIVFDIQNCELRSSADMPIIENKGTVTIQNGTIRKTGAQAAINNNGGTLYITGGNIIASGSGSRQAVYNDGGTTTISGSVHISATATDRAAVQNHKGTVNIIGGTIISSGFSAVLNENGKTMNIGTKDGNISTSSPIIQGIDYGISNDGTLKFYDGTIKGITNAFSSEPNDIETNSQIVNGTEQIDGETYKTAHLEISP